MNKPSERVVKEAYEGKSVQDSTGRSIILRKPSILDIYDLMKALGEDAKNPTCMGMAYNLLYVGMLDGEVFECPKTNKEIKFALQRLEMHGLNAISEGLEKYSEVKTEKEAIEEVKK